MPLFEVTLSDGSTHTMQAHSKKHLQEALAGVVLTRVTPQKYCKACRKNAATVQQTLCATCFDEALALGREVWKDVLMSEQALQDLVMSLFIDG